MTRFLLVALAGLSLLASAANAQRCVDCWNTDCPTLAAYVDRCAEEPEPRPKPKPTPKPPPARPATRTVEPTPVPLPVRKETPTPAPAPSPSTGGFTKTLGRWTAYRADANGMIYLWWDRGDPALEIPVSNGWWRYRNGGQESVHYSLRFMVNGRLDARPWTGRVPPPTGPLTSFAETNPFGTQRFDVSGDTLTVVFTDKGRLSVRGSSPTIEYVNPRGTKRRYGPGETGKVPGRATKAGQWTIYEPPSGDDVYLWYGSGEPALEIPASNGWWRLRANGTEQTIFSYGSPATSTFKQRPWPVTASGDFTSLSRTSKYGRQTIDHHDGRITVVFTDKGRLTLDARSPLVTHTSPDGRVRTWSSTSPGAGTTPPRVGFGAPDTHYTFGGWHLWRSSDVDHVSAWWGDGELVAEIPNSNGWWRHRVDGQERVVWSSGKTDSQPLVARPWQSHLPSAVEAPVGSFKLSKQSWTTHVGYDGRTLEVRFTNGTVLRLPRDAPKLEFQATAGPPLTWAPAAKARARVAPAPGVPTVSFTGTGVLASEERPFSFGVWHGWRAKDGRDLYLWTDGGRRALTLVGNSNGWFKWRDGTKEQVVLSSGGFDVDPFYDRPWDRLRTASARVGATDALDLVGSYGRTRMRVEGDALVVTFTDGGELRVSRGAAKATYRTKTGRSVALGG